MPDALNPNLLSDTLNVVQLARQAALARGAQDKAGKLSSVADKLHEVASQVGVSPASAAPAAAQTPAGSFRSLVSAMQEKNAPGSEGDPPAAPVNTGAILPDALAGISERNRLVQAMASGNMSEVDIARQLGLTRDEVRTILSLNRGSAPAAQPESGGEQ